MSYHADDLRSWARSDGGLTDLGRSTLLAAADYIEELEAGRDRDLESVLAAARTIEKFEAELAVLKPHRSQTVAYPEGHGPDDPPRPVLERTALAQQDFDGRT